MDARSKRSDEIAGRLRDEILNGSYTAGERLPAERDLAVSLGVNRGSVREALKTLEQLGLVVTRRGDGTTVRPLHEASLELVGHMLRVGDTVNRPLIEEMLDVHEMLLAGASYVVVERSSPVELARGRKVLHQLSEAATPVEFHERMGELMDQVAEASGNLVLRLFRNTVQPVLTETLKTLEPFLEVDRESVDRVLHSLDVALAAHDPAATERAVRAIYRIRREAISKALDVLEATGEPD
jgi:GntR family transcriptional repressor for pyruvate dehydrogenase complex